MKAIADPRMVATRVHRLVVASMLSGVAAGEGCRLLMDIPSLSPLSKPLSVMEVDTLIG
jgi:hypothetical protein